MPHHGGEDLKGKKAGGQGRNGHSSIGKCPAVITVGFSVTIEAVDDSAKTKEFRIVNHVPTDEEYKRGLRFKRDPEIEHLIGKQRGYTVIIQEDCEEGKGRSSEHVQYTITRAVLASHGSNAKKYASKHAVS